jgi:glucose-6-phosphate isomerase
MPEFLKSVSLGPLHATVEAALADLARHDIVSRIWEGDHTVWTSAPDEITNRLGWLTIIPPMREALPTIQGVVDDVRAEGYTHVLWMGMGGSSLAPDVFSRVFEPAEGYLDLAVLDSTDPAAVGRHAKTLDLARTLFVVATKSGTTAETRSFFKFFYNRCVAEMGAEAAGRHFVAVTDPGSKLAALGAELGFRHLFLNDPNIGGRFSVLSHFGLVAAALLGVDVGRLLDRAEAMATACGPDQAPVDNPGAWLGAVLGEAAQAGRDKVTFVASPSIASFGDWVEQLIAESTGKSGTGILPVVGAPVGAPGVYGDDRLFVYLYLVGEALYDPEVLALMEAGHPVVRLPLDDRYDLGAQFFLWEFATAVAGQRLGIQPFNQPNVEAAKRLAREMIAAYEEAGELPEGAAAPLDPAALRDILAQRQPGDYIAVQAFVPPSPAVDAALLALRLALRGRTGLAVTTGYGPRFLHSTGQLHKGDGGNGLFIQLTSDPVQDLPIPDAPGDEASAISFGVLKQAQALGDYRALEEADRRRVRFHLGTDVVGGIAKLIG